MAKVFISSTGHDLGEYREAALRVCQRLQLVPLAMEAFEATGVGVAEGSLRKLQEADVYVGIFAHRYGPVDTGHDTSVTELEFDTAGQQGLERLCFLIEEGYPWPPDAIDYERRPRLTALKERIRSRSTATIAEFTTADDFALKLMHALVAWKERHGRLSGPSPEHFAATGPTPVSPPWPHLLIGRDQALADLRSRLGLGDRPARHLTIVRGWPGVGKTTLVNALIHDPEVRAAFPDGVFWVPLGEQISLYPVLTAWGQRLGLLITEPRPSLEELVGQLRTLLERRRALLVVDDVWQLDTAVPFKQILGPHCALVLSTRFGDIARELRSEPDDVYVLEVLTEEKGMELLGRLAPQVARDLPEDSRGLVRDLEGLPLALRVAGRLLAGEAELGIDIRPLIAELRHSHRLLEAKAPDDRFDTRTGTTPTVDLLLHQSTDRLDRVTRSRFALLSLLAPKPASFALPEMRAVWDVADPMPTVRALVDRGLMEPLPAECRFQMHAVLVMHAASLLEE